MTSKKSGRPYFSVIYKRNVINYDPPREFASYLHRAGRSCRGNSEGGSSISLLVKKKDKKFARFLLENLKNRNVEIPKGLIKMAGKKSKIRNFLKKRNEEELIEKQQLGILN